MTQQPKKQIPWWLTIDLLVIVVSQVIIGIGMWRIYGSVDQAERVGRRGDTLATPTLPTAWLLMRPRPT
jgi:hypothetical protein